MSEESKRIVRWCPIHNIEMIRAKVTLWEDFQRGVRGEGVMVEGDRIKYVHICRECMKKQNVKKDGKCVRPADVERNPSLMGKGEKAVSG
ncbi:MAG: hypothetical protein KJ706_03030 [Candidatus Omnitrophica bacterium]|nr:hypothetical protein [Candidatus Omnitrophota bacterium]MCG2707900.1 hypothetical protein [Candidatus Omnitrophota bacterium]